MTSWPDARRTAHESASLLPAELTQLVDAPGRPLAEDLRALTALPPFDASAMDGWAVRGPGPWTVVGQFLAGSAPPEVGLRAGEAVEVATGAVVPAGCEGVLPYEQGSLSGTVVAGAHPGGRHVRSRGEECDAGEALLPAGTVVTAAALGLAAAVGHDHLLVRRVPRVAAVVTGAELLPSGLPEGGRIRDAVGPLLGPAVSGWGGQLVSLVHLGDDRDALRQALGAPADLVVTSGSSSAGPADHLSGVLAELGAQVLVDGVDVKPGHPQLLARLPHGTLVVGLPGNPLAALAGLVTLVAPVLRGLRGLPLQALIMVESAEDLPGHPTSHQLVPVRLDGGRARRAGHGGSAMLRGAALGEAFAVVPPGRPVRSGDQVAVLPLP